MSSSEFSEWRAFYQLDPFGTLRTDYQSGQICAIIASIVSGKDVNIENYMLNKVTDQGSASNVKAGDDVHTITNAGDDASGGGKTKETQNFLRAMGAVKNVNPSKT